MQSYPRNETLSRNNFNSESNKTFSTNSRYQSQQQNVRRKSQKQDDEDSQFVAIKMTEHDLVIEEHTPKSRPQLKIELRAKQHDLTYSPMSNDDAVRKYHQNKINGSTPPTQSYAKNQVKIENPLQRTDEKIGQINQTMSKDNLIVEHSNQPSTDNETETFQQKIENLRQLTKITSKFANGALIRPQLVQKISKNIAVQSKIPIFLRRTSSALQTKFSRKFKSNSPVNFQFQLPASLQQSNKIIVELNKGILTVRDSIETSRFRNQNIDCTAGTSFDRNDDSLCINPRAPPTYQSHTQSSQVKKEELNRSKFAKAIETVRNKQLKNSLLENSQVNSVCERVLEQCSQDAQFNQFFRKNLRLIQVNDQQRSGFRTRVGGSMPPSLGNGNFQFGRARKLQVTANASLDEDSLMQEMPEFAAFNDLKLEGSQIKKKSCNQDMPKQAPAEPSVQHILKNNVQNNNTYSLSTTRVDASKSRLGHNSIENQSPVNIQSLNTASDNAIKQKNLKKEVQLTQSSNMLVLSKKMLIDQSRQMESQLNQNEMKQSQLPTGGLRQNILFDSRDENDKSADPTSKPSTQRVTGLDMTKFYQTIEMANDFYDGFAKTGKNAQQIFTQIEGLTQLKPEVQTAKTTLQSPVNLRRFSPNKGPAFDPKKEIRFGALINNKRANAIRQETLALLEKKKEEGIVQFMDSFRSLPKGVAKIPPQDPLSYLNTQPIHLDNFYKSSKPLDKTIFNQQCKQLTEKHKQQLEMIKQSRDSRRNRLSPLIQKCDVKITQGGKERINNTKKVREWKLELTASAIGSSIGTISFKNSVDINGVLNQSHSIGPPNSRKVVDENPSTQSINLSFTANQNVYDKKQLEVHANEKQRIDTQGTLHSRNTFQQQSIISTENATTVKLSQKKISKVRQLKPRSPKILELIKPCLFDDLLITKAENVLESELCPKGFKGKTPFACNKPHFANRKKTSQDRQTFGQYEPDRDTPSPPKKFEEVVVGTCGGTFVLSSTTNSLKQRVRQPHNQFVSAHNYAISNNKNSIITESDNQTKVGVEKLPQNPRDRQSEYGEQSYRPRKSFRQGQIEIDDRSLTGTLKRNLLMSQNHERNEVKFETKDLPLPKTSHASKQQLPSISKTVRKQNVDSNKQ